MKENVVVYYVNVYLSSSGLKLGANQFPTKAAALKISDPGGARALVLEISTTVKAV